MKPRAMAQQGASLIEMLVVLALSSITVLAIGRLLPKLSHQQQQLVAQQRLQQELYHLLTHLEKEIRRAGYCNGEGCGRPGLIIANQGRCLLLSWDKQHLGRWRPPEDPHSDYYAYRLAQGKLQLQRGARQCEGGRWESLTHDSVARVEQFRVVEQGDLIEISLALSWRGLRQARLWRVLRENR